MDSRPDQVKPKTIKLVFVASLKTQQVMQGAFDIAKAVKQLVTLFQ
jgi:hypothetical protein